jgi:hypothetical protein
MTQRIAIETPNGAVYFGEECEKFKNKMWSREIFTAIRMNGGVAEVSWGTMVVWYGLDCIRPIQPKKMRPMNKSELVQLILKGAEFHYVDGRGSSIFPMIQDRALIPLTLNGWNLTKYSHYTLPGDPTERKLEVEE